MAVSDQRLREVYAEGFLKAAVASGLSAVDGLALLTLSGNDKIAADRTCTDMVAKKTPASK